MCGLCFRDNLHFRHETVCEMCDKSEEGEAEDLLNFAVAIIAADFHISGRKLPDHRSLNYWFRHCARNQLV